MFKFKGISSTDMQVVIEEEEHFIARAAQRYETIEIEGRNGAIFNELGYSYVERPIYVQCLNINKIDQILAWLNGEGEFEYKGRKTIARFYSQLDPQRDTCIRIIDTTFIRDPFWNKVNEEYQTVKDSKIKTITGNPIHITDSSNMSLSYRLNGGDRQELYLPKDYTQLKYIESSGTQYIDTGYKANQKTEYEIEFAYSSMIADSNGFVIGSRISSDSENISLTCDSGIAFAGRGNTYASLNISTIINQKYKFKVTENSIIKDGTVISEKVNDFGDASGTYNVRLFGCNQNGTTFRNFNGKIYYCKIWDNGELVREFIPCKRNSDSVLGMYDTVNNVFYTNAGSGTFTAGQEQRVSPNYPAPIETVGSNVNLFDKDNANTVNAYFSPTTNIASNSTAKILYIPCNSNTIYTVSKVSSKRFGIGFTDDIPSIGINILNPIEDVKGGTSLTQTSTSTSKYLCVYYYKSDIDTLTEQEILDSIKIEKGSKATPYSPYGMGSVEIDNFNKNFIKIQEMNKTESGLNISTNKNVVKINGTSTSGTNIYNFFEDIKLKKGTYTFSFISKNAPAINSCLFAFRDINNNGVLNLNGWGETNAKTIILEEDTIISGEKSSFYTNNNITFNNTKYELQIEQGSAATEIVTPESQTKIMPIQQEMLEGDYIEDIEHHEWGKVILDGTENINLDSTYQGISQFTLNNITNGKFVDDGKTISALSNYFKGVIWSYSWTKDNSIVIRNDSKGRIMSSEFTTAEQFKTFLQEQYSAGTPVIVYYKLATPIDLELTEEQEEAREGLNTYKNITNISVDNELATLDVEYTSETTEKITNEGNIYSEPIIRLEKTQTEAVELTINDIRFKYNFNNDEYVEINCEEKTVEYEGLNRNRQIEIGYDFPKLKVGENDIIMHSGDCVIKVLRKDRWL